MDYNFEWDPEKAKINYKKHKISFENSATIFKDERAITLYDDEHSEQEDRWITIGMTTSGGLIVMSHTFKDNTNNTALIRIISSRKATSRERKQYMEQ